MTSSEEDRCECVTDGERCECGACGGTGWIPRDPDIGTDQECSSCDATGFFKEWSDDDRKRLDKVLDRIFGVD